VDFGYLWDTVAKYIANHPSPDMDVDEKEEKDLEVYLPGKPLGKDEVLEADQSVYEMLHKLNVEWPCLSFDILQDRLGDDRKNVGIPLLKMVISSSFHRS